MIPLLPALLLLLQAKPEPAPAPALDSRAQAITTDGAHFAWSLDDGSVHIVPLAGGAPAEIARTKGDRPAALAFSNDGKELAVGSAGGSLQILSVPEGKLLAELPRAAAAPGDAQAIDSIDWLADGSRLLLAGARARLVERQGLKLLAEYEARAGERLGARAVSGDGAHFALGDSAGEVRVFAARDGLVEHEHLSVPKPVHALALDRQATRLAVGAGDCRVRVFRLGKEERPLELSLCDQDITGKLVLGCVDFAPDGSALVASSFPWWCVRAWELEHGSVLWSHDCGGGADLPTPVSLARDPAIAFVGSQGTRLEAANGKVLSSLGNGRFRVQGAWCWTREGDAFRVFDVRAGKLVRELPLSDPASGTAR